MLETIISGGQTGVGQAAWRAAKSCGLKTGGMMPQGFRTEKGRRPEFRNLFGAEEHGRGDYGPGRESNMEMAGATLVVMPSRLGDVDEGRSRERVLVAHHPYFAG